MTVDKDTSLTSELLILGFIAPPFTFGVILAVNVDIVVISFKILSQPCSLVDVRAQAPSGVVSPGNIGDSVVEECGSTRLRLYCLLRDIEGI
jgi:hypothetical protein